MDYSIVMDHGQGKGRTGLEAGKDHGQDMCRTGEMQDRKRQDRTNA